MFSKKFHTTPLSISYYKNKIRANGINNIYIQGKCIFDKLSLKNCWLSKANLYQNGVDGGTKIEPDDIYNLSYFDNVVNLIHLLKNSTKDYYNMKKVVGW